MKTKSTNRVLAKSTYNSDVISRYCGRGNVFPGAYVFFKVTELTIPYNYTETLIKNEITAKIQKRGQP